MKKICNYIFIFLIVFFFKYNNLVVYADNSCGNDGATHELVYDITNLAVDNTKISFKGYAFIDHYDNYGGKNVTISIIASKSSSVSGINNNNSYTISENSYNGVDLYGTRCTAGGCLNSIKNKLEENIKNNGYGYANCNGDRTETLKKIGVSYGGNSVGGTCVIHQVGFNISFNYDNLISELNVTEEDEIYFYIQVSGQYTKNCWKTEKSAIGVNNKACKVNNDSCINGKNYELEKFSFTLAGISDKAEVVAYRARIMNDSYKAIHESGHYFKKNDTFHIINYNPSVSGLIKNTMNSNTADYNIEISNISFYELATNGTCSSDNYETCNNNGDFTLYKGSSQNTGTSYYAYSSWLKVAGQVKLKGLKKREPSIQTNCSKINSWSGSDNYTEKDVECGGSQSYKACINISEDDNNAISGKIYVKSQSSLSSKQCGSAGGKYLDGNCYFPVTVKASVSIYQHGVYEMGNVSPNSIRAGQPFNFSTSSYTNTISWINNKKWDESRYYYLYKGFKNCECSGSSCSCTDSSVSDNYKALYYASGTSSETCQGTANSVSKCAIEDAIKNKFDTSGNGLTGIYTSGEYDNSSGKEFPADWSGSSGEGSLSSITDSDGHTFDVKEIESSYTFNLRDGYLNIQDVTDIQYPATDTSPGDSYVKFGKRIYVPLKYRPGSEYTINLKKSIGSTDSDNGISFVTGIKWGIKGTCQVNVKPGLYDCPNSTCDGYCDTNTQICSNLNFAVKYRSIDVSNPFPKGTRPANWSDDSDVARVNRSYNNYPDVPDYSYSGTFDFSDSVPYTSWGNIDSSGSSKFVISNFSKFPSTDNYCPLGEFRDDCD